MGASIALAGATACTRQPDELIVPYVRQPEDVVPGQAAVLRHDDDARRRRRRACWPRATRGGRPSSKAIPIIRRASARPTCSGRRTVLTMYDPDRTQSITYLGEIRPWGSFVQAMRNQLGELTGARRRRAALPQPRPSARPRWRRSFTELLAALPQAKWHQYEPGLARQRARRAARSPSATPVDVHYRLDQADVIVALDADLFGAATPGNVRYARDFANGRRVRKREGRDEPAVRRRADADADRIDRRPSPAAQAPAR